MREYETLYLLQPDLSAEQIEEIGKKLSDFVVNHKGQVLTLFNLGKRRLAYRVGKHHQGVYIYLNYLAEGSVVAEIERVLKYDDRVLRFITVKLEDEVNVEERVKEKREFTLATYEDAQERYHNPEHHQEAPAL